MTQIELENKIKDEICDVCNKMWQQGWVAANDGNVSVKIGEDTYFATPTGISKSFIKPEMLLKINGEGEVLEGLEQYRPSSEIKMHLRCYKDRPDVKAVVHAHPPTATGFALAKIPMDTYSLIESVIAIGSVPIAPFAIPSTDEVPESIAPFLQEHDVILLENHGALTVGSDLITAYYRMETLELWAKTSLVARTLRNGKAEEEISRENLEILFDMRENYKVTGKHPGYRKYNK
ncbi:MAG TPA: class II aldolase/adducin family protein [Erysipelothrix sp.]